MVMAMKSDERFDFVVFGAKFDLKSDASATLGQVVYQKTLDEVSEMLGKPLVDRYALNGIVVQGFMLKSEYEATAKKGKRWW